MLSCASTPWFRVLIATNRFPDPRRGSRSRIAGPLRRERPVSSSPLFTGPVHACAHLLPRTRPAAPGPRAARGECSPKWIAGGGRRGAGLSQIRRGGARHRPPGPAGAGSGVWLSTVPQSNRGSNPARRSEETGGTTSGGENRRARRRGLASGEVPGRWSDRPDPDTGSEADTIDAGSLQSPRRHRTARGLPGSRLVIGCRHVTNTLQLTA